MYGYDKERLLCNQASRKAMAYCLVSDPVLLATSGLRSGHCSLAGSGPEGAVDEYGDGDTWSVVIPAPVKPKALLQPVSVTFHQKEYRRLFSLTLT